MSSGRVGSSSNRGQSIVVPPMGDNGFMSNPRDLLTPQAEDFFDSVAPSQGRPRDLSPDELGTAISEYAPQGKFTLDSYSQLFQDLGLPRDVAVRSYQALAAQNGGKVSLDTVMEFLSDYAGKRGGWNKDQFAEGFDALAQSGEKSDDPIKTGFDQMSGGNGRLTTNELGKSLTKFARGKTFSADEFKDFGASLGFDAKQSQAVFSALKATLGREPSVEDVVGFASQFADEKGQWNIDQFSEVIGELGKLAQGGQPQPQSPIQFS